MHRRSDISSPLPLASFWAPAPRRLDEVTTGGYHPIMKAVGIKVLKARLSEYIRLAKGGETILVTERDEVVAEIRPARRQPTGTLTMEEALEAMAERGEATLASASFKDWKSLPGVPPATDLSSQKILDALREDRRS